MFNSFPNFQHRPSYLSKANTQLHPQFATNLLQCLHFPFYCLNLFLTCQPSHEVFPIICFHYLALRLLHHTVGHFRKNALAFFYFLFFFRYIFKTFQSQVPCFLLNILQVHSQCLLNLKIQGFFIFPLAFQLLDLYL